MRTTTPFFRAALAGLAILTSGCGQGPATPAAAQPAQLLEETFRQFGNYEIHFNALRTDTLTPQIASSYGIQRSSSRVLLNVTILQKQADHVPRKPVEAVVQVDAYNLTGQLKNLEMRRVSEGEAIYYIGEVSISGTEVLVFDIAATPTGETAPLTLKFKREFYSN
jgi:hypothetical protein